MESISGGRNLCEESSKSGTKSSETSFLSLPSELLAEIIKELDWEDRRSLASVDSRMNEIERTTGHRRFDVVCVFNGTGDIMAKSGSLHKLFSRSSPKEEVITFFTKSVSDCLEIYETPFDSEERLLALVKSLAYNRLVMRHISVCRILKELCSSRRLDNLSLHWSGIVHGNDAKRVIKNIPLNKLQNLEVVKQTLLDDDFLLYIANNISISANIESRLSMITSGGIQSVFEIVYRDDRQRTITFFAPTHTFAYFFLDVHDDPQFTLKTANGIKFFETVDGRAAFAYETVNNILTRISMSSKKVNDEFYFEPLQRE